MWKKKHFGSEDDDDYSDSRTLNGLALNNGFGMVGSGNGDGRGQKGGGGDRGRGAGKSGDGRDTEGSFKTCSMLPWLTSSVVLPG